MKKQDYINGQKNWPTRLLAKRQLDFVDLHAGGRILDVGCGEGIIGASYDNVTSCDVRDYNKFGIKVDIASAENLPYPDKSFDTVCLIGVIEHTDNPGKVLSECKRVGGRLIITYPEGWGWKVLSKIMNRDSIKLHADFQMNGHTSGWWLIERKRIIPSFFIGEVYV